MDPTPNRKALLIIIIMSDASIGKLVCKPTDGKTRISFNRFISDGNSSDDGMEDEESDDNKTSESMEDMANDLKQVEDADAAADAGVNKRSRVDKEGSFLFQRVAVKLEHEQRARRKQSMKVLHYDADRSLNNQSTTDGSSSMKPPFDGFPKTIELCKFLSSCLLLSLPSIISLFVAVILLLLVNNNGDQGRIPTAPFSSPAFTVAPSLDSFPAPTVVASHSTASWTDDDSTDITRTTSLPETLKKKIGSVLGASGATKSISNKKEHRLIGLIDSPMDPDELILLVETNPDFAGGVHKQHEKHKPALNMSVVREIINEDGSTIYCNVMVDEIAVVVECPVNEEMCRVYDGTATSSFCDNGESSS